MEYTRWQKLMNALGISDNTDVYKALMNAYKEKHRFYHNISHIESTLQYLDLVSTSANHPEEIELALWFHDAIYKPLSSRNELDSANWASEFLSDNAISPETIDRVHHLIIATQHSAELIEHDEKLIVDIDLSILGHSFADYEQFEIAIRKEYKWIPYSVFSKKRKDILQSFLNRKRIYNNDTLFNLLEKQARTNIERAISNL